MLTFSRCTEPGRDEVVPYFAINDEPQRSHGRVGKRTLNHRGLIGSGQFTTHRYRARSESGREETWHDQGRLESPALNCA